MGHTSPWTSQQFSAEPSGGDDGEYRSLALPGLVERLDGGRKWRVLDLGRVHGATVEFFSQYPCRLYVADLYRSLMIHRADSGVLRLPEEPEDEEIAAAERVKLFDELLPYELDTRFDLILAWDLLNYLEPAQIEVLSRRLATFCYDGSRLFAMVAIHREIPARPCAFRIRDAETLEYEKITRRTRPAPRHPEPVLRRLMSGFEVESACVLRNGLQEYVFSFTSGLAQRQAG